MAVNKQQTFGDSPIFGAVQITSTDGTSRKDLAASPDTDAGLRVDFIRVVTDSAVDVDIEFHMRNTATSVAQPLGVQTVAAGQGKSADVQPLEAMLLLLPDSILVPPGHSLQVSAVASVASGKTVYVSAFGTDLTSH